MSFFPGSSSERLFHGDVAAFMDNDALEEEREELLRQLKEANMLVKRHKAEAIEARGVIESQKKELSRLQAAQSAPPTRTIDVRDAEQRARAAELALTQAEADAERQAIEWESELRKCKTMVDRVAAERDDLRSELMAKNQKIASKEEVLRMMKITFEAEKAALVERMNDVEESRKQSNAKEVEERLKGDASHLVISKMEQDVREAQHAQQQAEAQATHLQKENKLLQKRLKKAIAAVAPVAPPHHQDVSLIDTLRNQLDSAKERERKWMKELKGMDALRPQASHARLLQEQLDSLQQRLQVAEKEASRVVRLEAERDALKEERASWINEMKGLDAGEYPSPMALVRALKTARRRAVLASDQLSELSSRVGQAEVMTESAEKRTLVAQKEEEDARKEIFQVKSEARRLGRRVKLLEREREEHRTLLDSMQRTGVDTGLEQRLDALNTTLQRSEERAASLEQELSATESALNKERDLRQELETQLDEQKLSASGKRLRSGQDRVSDADALHKENERLLKEVETLYATIAMLERRVGRGDFDPTTTKVLRLGNNPSKVRIGQEAVKKSDLASLQQENVALAARVEELEKAVGGPGAAAQAAEVRASLKSAEVKQLRLKEVFRRKIQEFREACYVLTGFRIDMIGQRYRLRSMYAEREEDHLLFQATDDGGMELLETAFSGKLSKEMTTYLTTCHSIPGFLAALTLDLFGNQTFAV